MPRLLVCLCLVSTVAVAAEPPVDEYVQLEKLYQHLHRNPELSFKEEKTAARLAKELRQAGFKVTMKVGGHGVVGVLENGEGPVVMLRADMDALPVPEQTGLPYASAVTTVDDLGKTVPVMHACGHDMHMTVWAGTARRLAAMKDKWRGTLMMVAQPAEEKGLGAQAMLNDGLFELFPRPDYAFALHVSAERPAGKVGWVSGYALANVDWVDLTVHGQGGHGAYPHTTKDPIVLSAQIINALQTLVSRELKPGEAGVVTVGSIHGGAKHNVIPDRVDLQLTVRSYSDESRKLLLDGIRRVAENQARVAGMPEDRLPEMKVLDGFTPALYNDPELTTRLVGALERSLGPDRLVQVDPVMGGEDFSFYGRVEPKIPIVLFWLGAVDPEKVKAAEESGAVLPSLHSSQFAPLPEPAIRTGVDAMTAVALELLARGPASSP
jgi:hippurate hydrolase